jgi:hypothetical protein
MSDILEANLTGEEEAYLFGFEQEEANLRALESSIELTEGESAPEYDFVTMAVDPSRRTFLSSTYDNVTKTFVLTTVSQDPEDNYMHVWRLSAEEGTPSLQVSFVTRKEPHDILSQLDVTYLHIGEVTSDKSQPFAKGQHSHFENAWDFTFLELQEDGVDVITFEFSTPALYTLGNQVLSGAISAEPISYRGRTLTPTSLSLRYQCDDVSYRYPGETVPVLWFSYGDGHTAQLVNDSFIQFGFGDGWLEWYEMMTPDEFAYDGINPGDARNHMPLAAFPRSKSLVWDFNLWHDIERILQRRGDELYEDVVALDDWTLDTFYEEWSQQRQLSAVDDRVHELVRVTSTASGHPEEDNVLFNMFYGSPVPQQEAIYHSFGHVEFVHRNDSFISLRQGFRVNNITITPVSRPKKTVMYVPDQSTRQHKWSQWKDALTGDIVGVFEYSVVLSDARGQSNLSLAMKMDIAATPAYYEQRWALPSRPQIKYELLFEQVGDVFAAGECQLKIHSSVHAINVDFVSDDTVVSSGGHTKLSTPTVDGQLAADDSYYSRVVDYETVYDLVSHETGIIVDSNTTSVSFGAMFFIDFGLMASESSITAARQQQPPSFPKDNLVVPRVDDDVLQAWADYRFLSLEQDEITGMVSIVTTSGDDEDPFVHSIGIGSQPFPFVYSIYLYYKDNKHETLSNIDIDFFALGELNTQSEMDAVFDRIRKDNVQWTIKVEQKFLPGEVAAVHNITLEADATEYSGPQTLSFLISDRPFYLHDVDALIKPYSLYFAYSVQDIMYQEPHAIAALWTASEVGAPSYLVNATALQFNVGDGWLTWDSSSVPSRWDGKGGNIGFNFRALPISAVPRSDSGHLKGHFTHDLLLLGKRFYTGDRPRADPYTLTDYYKDWASRRKLSGSNDYTTRDGKIVSTFTNGHFKDRIVFHHNGYLDSFDVTFHNDEVANYHQELKIAFVTFETLTGKVYTYRPLINEGVGIHSDWKDPETGAVVEMIQHTSQLDGGEDEFETTIHLQSLMYLASQKTEYYGMSLEPDKASLFFDFDFRDLNLDDDQLPGVLTVFYDVLTTHNSLVDNAIVGSPNGFVQFLPPIVDGEVVEEHITSLISCQQEKGRYRFEQTVPVNETMFLHTTRAVFELDTSVLVSPQTISQVKDYETYLPAVNVTYYRPSDVSIYTNQKGQYIVVDVASPESQIKSTYIIQTQPTISILSYSYATEPFVDLFEYSYVELKELVEETVGAHFANFKKRYDFGQAPKWDIRIDEGLDPHDHYNFASFRLSTTLSFVDERASSTEPLDFHPEIRPKTFDFYLHGRVSAHPDKLNALSLTFGVPRYEYATHSSFLQVECQAQRFMVTEMDAVFQDYGDVNDVVKQGHVLRAGASTLIRLNRNKETDVNYVKQLRHKEVV